MANFAATLKKQKNADMASWGLHIKTNSHHGNKMWVNDVYGHLDRQVESWEFHYMKNP